LGILAGLPLTVSVAGDLLGGWATDGLVRRFGLRIGRCGLALAAYALAAVLVAVAGAASGAYTAAFAITAAAAFTMFSTPATWACCIEMGGRDSAVLSATMNTAGQIGGIMSPIVLAYIVDRTGNWALPLYVLSGYYLVAAACWLFIRPDRPLHPKVPLAPPVGLHADKIARPT
jgi:nitrate/nitrite transporter NarK